LRDGSDDGREGNGRTGWAGSGDEAGAGAMVGATGQSGSTAVGEVVTM